MISGNYFFDDGKSRKFWSYTLDGGTLTTRHGRIGTAGRETTKSFETADETAAKCVEFDAHGQKIFHAAHQILAAGSFHEFLTRLAIHEDPSAAIEPATASAPSPDPVQTKTPKPPSSRDRSGLSKGRQDEIRRLACEGGDELSAAIDQGKKAAEQFRRQIHREISKFLKSTTDKRELHFFSENWHWEAGVGPILELIKNPHVDAGTLLQMFWHTSPEDYYLNYRTEADVEDMFERDVFRALRQIERRFVNGQYNTAAIPFDPKVHISIRDKRSEFARPIPDVMYEPIASGKRRGK